MTRSFGCAGTAACKHHIAPQLSGPAAQQPNNEHKMNGETSKCIFPTKQERMVAAEESQRPALLCPLGERISRRPNCDQKRRCLTQMFIMSSWPMVKRKFVVDYIDSRSFMCCCSVCALWPNGGRLKCGTTVKTMFYLDFWMMTIQEEDNGLFIEREIRLLRTGCIYVSDSNVSV